MNYSLTNERTGEEVPLWFSSEEAATNYVMKTFPQDQWNDFILDEFDQSQRMQGDIESERRLVQTQESVQEPEQAKQETRERGQRIAEGGASVMDYLKYAGRTPARLVSGAVEGATSLISGEQKGKTPREIGQSVSDYLISPYESDVAEDVLGDPTLALPSPAGKALSGAKVGKYLGRYAKPLKTAVVGAEQGALSTAAREGNLEGSDLAGGAAGASIIEGAGRTVGAALKGGGKKLIQAAVKPKKGLDSEGDIVENALQAVTPEGKKAVGVSATTKGVLEDIYSTLDNWQEIQGKALDEGETNTAFTGLIALSKKYQDDFNNKAIDRNTLQKKMNVIDLELDRLRGNKQGQVVIPEAPIKQIHGAKVDVGKKSRFDVKNVETADATVRDTYRDIYGVYSDAISTGERVSKITDPFSAIPESEYQRATSAMAPLMSVVKPIEQSVERQAKNNPLSLTGSILGAGTYGATDNIPLTVGMMLAPRAIQSIPTGVAAYRAGEALQRVAPYAGSRVGSRSMGR